MTLSRITITDFFVDFKIKLTFNTDNVGAVNSTEIPKGSIFSQNKKNNIYPSNCTLNPCTMYRENDANFSPKFLQLLATENQSILS